MSKNDNYMKTYETLKNVMESYDSYDNKNDFFMYLNDSMKISPAKLSILYDNLRNYISFLDIVTYDDDEMLRLINKIRIINDEYSSFCKKYFYCDSYKQVGSYDADKMFSMFDLIDGYIDKKLNLYLLIYKLIKNENILYKDLKHYSYDVNSYCNSYNNNNVQDFRMKSVYTFRDMYDLYRKIIYNPDFILKVLKKGSNDDFISFIYYVKSRNGVSSNNLEKSLSSYVGNENVKKFIDSYDKFYSKYKNNKKEKEKRERLSYIHSVIRGFIDGKYNDLEEYCNENGVIVATFRNYLTEMRKNNDPIFDEYDKYRKSVEDSKSEFYHNCIDQAVYNIRNGVNEDGTVRPYDLLDYYSDFDISLNDLFRYAHKYLNSTDHLQLSLFYSKYKNESVLTNSSIKDLFSINMVLFREFDDDGEIINPGYEVTIYDKERVISELKEREIPLTNITFSLMLERCIKNNDLNIQKKNTIK